MALFVFGAGATRGCDFVNPTNHPCLPPVDRDFFTQLQRVQNEKHRQLIKDVMRDVVDVFGTNFDVTMENVFTTLEHTIRMITTTGETRAFRKRDLEEKTKRLTQAIAVVLEDALTGKQHGHSSHKPRMCSYHRKFVEETLKPGDDIITFNYDCVLDYSLATYGSNKWNARFGYGFDLGPRGKFLSGDTHWQPKEPATRATTAHVYKLHGSLHFYVTAKNNHEYVKLKERPYTKQHGTMRFTIIPPEWSKPYDTGVFARLWKLAAAAINRAEHIAIVGYSLPPTDLHTTALLRTAIKTGQLKALLIANPDSAARKRTRTILQRGLQRHTKVLSCNDLSEFVNIPRKTWAV